MLAIFICLQRIVCSITAFFYIKGINGLCIGLFELFIEKAEASHIRYEFVPRPLNFACFFGVLYFYVVQPVNFNVIISAILM